MAQTIDIFSSLQLARTADGGFFETCRNEEEVVCPAFDEERQCVVELHIAHSEGPTATSIVVFERLACRAVGLKPHPNLTKVHEYGEDDGANFFVCEFVDGEELGAYLNRCGPLPTELTLRIMRDAARGLLACSNAVPVLAGLDLFRSKVILSGNSLAGFGLKIGGFGFGDPKAEELPASTVHRYYVGALARLGVWAMTGRHIRHGELDSESLAALDPLLHELLDALDGDEPIAESLDDACQLIQTAFEAFRPKGLERFPAALVPKLPLQPILVERSAISSYLGPDSQLDGDPFDGRTPYRLRTIDADSKETGVVQVLPESEFLPERVSDDLLAALRQGNALDHPNLIRLLDYWPSENCAFFIEEEVGHIDLAALIKWQKSLSPVEVLEILEQLESASQQAATCGLTIHPTGAGQVVIHFLDPRFSSDDPTVTKLVESPLSDWPDFRIKVRTYPTFLSLVRPANELLAEPPDGAKAFAWWAQRLLGGNEPPKVRSLLSDVLSGRAGALIQSGSEFHQAFRSLIEDPEPKPEAIPLESGRTFIAGLTGKQSTQPSESESHPDEFTDEDEPAEQAPGLAEVLFQEEADEDNTDDQNLAGNEAKPHSPLGNFLLTLLVVVIALLLAAIFAQLSGEAFWLK